MKKILVLLLYCLASCQDRKCECIIDANIISKNDSLVNEYVNPSRTALTDYWSRFNEPILQQSQVESYRFAITVLVYDYFKVYRVEKKGKTYNLEIKEYAVSTTTWQRKDSLVSHASKQITKSEWESIDNAFRENCFWTMAADIENNNHYLDGSIWVLEGYRSNPVCTNAKYHVAFRNSPDSSNFRTICEKFMQLDSLDIRFF